MKITTVKSLADLMHYYKFRAAPILVEDDLDVVETECDLHERKLKDAEALCTVVANCSGNCLDIGTSHGRSAFKMSTNLKEGTVYTVNVLPEQITSDEKLITHLLSREEIGSFYRRYGVSNVEQIYANTLNWRVPDHINNLSVAFVDGNHDSFSVYSDTKLAYHRLKPGGFILWHDFNPELRKIHSWIDAAMTGMERFLEEYGIGTEIVHLENSWIGIMKKPLEPASKLTFPAVEATAKSPRVLVGYSDYRYPTSVAASNEAWLARLRRHGYQVDGFCLTLSPPADCLLWPDLDQKWKDRDPALLEMYQRLLAKVSHGGYDIFINYNGINLHHDFVRQLRTLCFCVYACFDDPESSDILSRPVAAAYDLAMPGNIAELESYRAWGCRNVAWLPLGFRADEYDPQLSARDILERERKVDIAIVCERESPWRRDRLDHLAREFPDGYYFGKGWPAGFIREAYKIPLYQETRIGFNIHNSTGPINYRTFTLPANGALLLCDNSSHLGKIFELGREAVGYDYMEEAVFKARFFLKHEKMRREIALAGWHRALADYNEAACFRRILDTVDQVRREEAVSLPPAGAAKTLQPFTTLGLKWHLDPERYIDRTMLEQGGFELATTRQLAAIVRPGMKWLDVGANIGYYTLLLSQWATESGSGFSFEPTPILLERLQHHVRLNRFDERVTVLGFGLSDQERSCEIGYDIVSSTLHWPEATPPANTASVTLRRLDDLTGIVDGPRIDILKVDIDGHEPFFFRGARGFFALHRPIIAMEFANLSLFSAGESVFTLLRELEEIGYVVYSETTGRPFNDLFAFLVECGNYATSANAWALPREIANILPDLASLPSMLPRSATTSLEVYSSITDMLVAEHVAPGCTAKINLASLGNRAVQLRGGTSDATVLWDTFHFKYHLPPSQLSLQSTILDLGCNVGFTSAHMAHLYPRARLIAVEMDQNNYRQALLNTAPFSDRCTVLHGAIWGEDGEVGYTGTSEQGFHVNGDANGRRVRSFRIDTLMREQQVSWVDYMKIDIEGAEREILSGNIDWLGRVGSLKIEIHRMEDYDALQLVLERHGFICTMEPRHYCCIEAVRNVKAPITKE